MGIHESRKCIITRGAKITLPCPAGTTIYVVDRNELNRSAVKETRISRVDRCRDFLVADRWRRQDRQHAGLPRGSLGRRRGVRNRRLGGLPFRREECLGCLVRARDPLTIIAARRVMLLPVVEQGSSRLFGCSRYRSGIRQLWQVVTADAGCHVNIKINKSP